MTSELEQCEKLFEAQKPIIHEYFNNLEASANQNDIKKHIADNIKQVDSILGNMHIALRQFDYCTNPGIKKKYMLVS
jgi:hypothetical protein